MSTVEIQIAQGWLRADARGGVITALGVPYAAPPAGEHRFNVPQPVMPWAGVRDARQPGPTAPQRGSRRFAGLDVFPATGAQWRRGDDYLTLNVWAPAGADHAPVLVYVHGGGLVLGTKDAAVYDGRAFARDGVVCVTLNYRLGVEGFVPIPDAPTNLGLRDVIAALHWVRTNIAAFGGDPGNVTLVGESGGGIAVACLLTSPLTTGLVHRGIIQSGHGSAVYSLEVASRVTRRLAARLGVHPDVDGFRSVPAEDLVDALARLSRPGAVDMRDENGIDPSFGLGIINPVFGDDVVPVRPLQALEAGAAAELDILIGTTEDEANFWFAPTRLLALPHWAARLVLRRLAPDADTLFATYRRSYPGQRGGELLSRILGDLAFRQPVLQYAAAHTGRTHVYEFDWDSDAVGGRMGAAHGLDLAFAFDTIDVIRGPRGLAGTNPPQDLADRVHRLWVNFVTDGTLPWAAYEPGNRVITRLSGFITSS